MDNQHKLIKGYRDLTKMEIDLINDIKSHSMETEALLLRVKEITAATRRNTQHPDEKVRMDAAEPERWLAMAKTDFQNAFMKAVRAVAQPTTF